MFVEADGAVAFVGGHAALVEVVTAFEHLYGVVLIPLVHEGHRALVAGEMLRCASFHLFHRKQEVSE